MIVIIDYGMGNLHSVQNALDKLGVENVISREPETILNADKLILPGVGAFADCMKNLEEYGLVDVIKKAVNEKKTPLLGICLGMQALFSSSMENGYTKGFGFLQGDIVLMEDTNVRIPHIGWNDLKKAQDHPIFSLISTQPYVYYVHSYYATNMNKMDLIGYSNYGSLIIPGLVGHANVLGCQFHPEKSAEDGLKILKYFVEEF